MFGHACTRILTLYLKACFVLVVDIVIGVLGFAKNAEVRSLRSLKCSEHHSDAAPFQIFYYLAPERKALKHKITFALSTENVY